MRVNSVFPLPVHTKSFEMISFRLSDIPEGTSEQVQHVSPEEMGIEQSDLTSVKLHFRFNKQHSGLQISCDVIAFARFQCDRSLEYFETELSSEYEMVFQHKIDEEREDVTGSLRRLKPSQNVIDVTSELRDTVLLSIPVKKLHPRFLKDGVVSGFEARFGDDSGQTDPRWEKLSKLRQQSE